MPTDGALLSGEKVLHAPGDQAVLDRFAAAFGEDRRQVPQRIMVDPEKVGRDLARLVLGVIELLRDLMERQAVRRVESGALSDEEIERLGQTLLALQVRMSELKAAFGLENQDLTLDLGPLRDLVSDFE
jgi:hypothetical protein